MRSLVSENPDPIAVRTHSVVAMSSFSTRWSVLQAHDVAGSDLDPDGFLADDALERWIAEARAAYVDQCSRLHKLIALEHSARHFN